MEDPFRFIADVHLGKLARMLRMLGFDTVYQNNLAKEQLVGCALAEKRILLSRDAHFAKIADLRFVQMQTEHPFGQLINLISLYHLAERFKPFSRCMVCNGRLIAVDKESITGQLEDNTRNYIQEFWQCLDCSQIFWKGSHYKRMMRFIERLETSIKNKEAKN